MNNEIKNAYDRIRALEHNTMIEEYYETCPPPIGPQSYYTTSSYTKQYKLKDVVQAIIKEFKLEIKPESNSDTPLKVIRKDT